MGSSRLAPHLVTCFPYLGNEVLHLLKVDQTLFMRLAQILANQCSIDSALVELDQGVRGKG
jgi:hypothetical protein